ncbi:DUF1285 domain-containing protein [Shewanella intestini]|uniref:DUF1285 domain-containing protein n=2 Tax=Shewanellaceae TaxID=267890 RepID=A0ABS5I2A1_9GAMM|nr:DUF1285 domain-containing protein [Shewanella intestini]MRG36193.1 DUF1285 domain-containing protein [Shewanella sp. XMDDZSB0408]
MGEVPLCSGDVVFHILDNGDWLYQQSPLPTKFAKLFASILHRNNKEYSLITPVEKVKVDVAEHAFLLVDYTVESTVLTTAHTLVRQGNGDNQQSIVFESSIGSQFTVFKADVMVCEQSIVVKLPRGLTAKLNRNCYYRYIDEMLSD